MKSHGRIIVLQMQCWIGAHRAKHTYTVMLLNCKTNTLPLSLPEVEVCKHECAVATTTALIRAILVHSAPIRGCGIMCAMSPRLSQHHAGTWWCIATPLNKPLHTNLSPSQIMWVYPCKNLSHQNVCPPTFNFTSQTLMT